MTFNAMTEHYEEITVCGKPALFTSIRIKRDTVPDGLYAYDVRHDLHDMGSRVFGLDVADLTVNALFCSRNSAIAINTHNFFFLYQKCRSSF